MTTEDFIDILRKIVQNHDAREHYHDLHIESLHWRRWFIESQTDLNISDAIREKFIYSVPSPDMVKDGPDNTLKFLQIVMRSFDENKPS